LILFYAIAISVFDVYIARFVSEMVLLKNGYLSARSKNFLQMEPTNWQQCYIRSNPPILMYCIDHLSDILLEMSLKIFILKNRRIGTIYANNSCLGKPI